jgi:signal transduction histidine kinase
MKAFLKKSIYLIVSLFLFAFQLIYSQHTKKLAWHFIDSPIYSDLNNLVLFSPNSGIVAGKQILILKNGQWEKMPQQPPSNINLLSANSLNSIFVTISTKFQESEMYYWDGNTWNNLYHPLANTISSMQFIDRNNGVICGLGEIAVLKNNKWEFLPTPTNNFFKKVLLQKDGTIWVLVSDKGIYKKTNTGWEKIKKSDNVNLIGMYNKKIYALGNNFLGTVISDSLKIISSDNRLKDILSFSLTKNNKIFVVGNNGLILHYSNRTWSKMESNATEKLNTIYMLSSTNGFAAGNDGVILHYTNSSKKDTVTTKWKGFEKITFYSDSKVVDDEYGVVTADFNNDGMTDIFTCGLYEKNHLYINKGSFKFVDEGNKRGVSGKNNKDYNQEELNLGACAGDYDNDGYIDLYLSSLVSANKLYHNLGNGNFIDYSNISGGIGNSTDRTNAVISGDVDNDGDLDLFLCNENTTNRLFENNGVGIFTEITNKANLISKFGGTGASFADIDNDGDLDLFVTNWSTTNKLYKNLFIETGNLNFNDFTDSANVAGDVFTKSNGVVFADIDNDADMDIYVTNRKTPNIFYLNNGKGIFSNQTKKFFGVKDSLKSYGIVIADFDYDGYKDLYLANVGNNKFYKNINGQKFIDKTELFDANIKGYSTGVAAADFNNDNLLDLYVANYIGNSSTLLKNKSYAKNIITIKIKGINNNSLAIGSKVYVYESGYLGDKSHLIYYNEISGGSGYASMNDLKCFVPHKNKVDLLVVFPRGEKIIKKSVSPGKTIIIDDISGTQRIVVSVKKYISRFLFDPHRLFETLKWFLVLSILFLSGYRGNKKYSWSLKNIFIITTSVVVFYYFLQSIFEYDSLFLSTILPIAGIGIILSVIHLSYERTKLKDLNEIEKQKLQEKLSRDLHDDLASTLSTISIYLELLKQAINNNSENVWILFNKANNLLSNAKQTITDLIWTIKPTPEPLTNFATRIRENFSDVFRNKNIAFSVSEQNVNNQIFLSALEKHNIYLIIKEALNNILKHSLATKVKIKISIEESDIIIVISDNGTGFNFKDRMKYGNGITNMINRGNEVKAKVKIFTKNKSGTIIEILLEK